jgi:ATP-dependent Clp protease ATP-binding subunit ClpX
LFRDYKYYLAGSGLSQLRVTAELVREPKRVLDRLMAEGEKHEGEALKANALQFADRFKRQHGLEIVFDESALQRLTERAHAERMSMLELCAHLFKDYQFGLSLIQKNTGQKTFTLTSATIEAPDKYLSELVVQSYYPASPKT